MLLNLIVLTILPLFTLFLPTFSAIPTQPTLSDVSSHLFGIPDRIPNILRTTEHRLPKLHLAEKLTNATEVLPQCSTETMTTVSIAFDKCSECPSKTMCPDECCVNSFTVSGTTHFTWCFRNCCNRLISLQLPPKPTENETNLVFATQVQVVNDVTFRGIGDDKSCRVGRWPSRKCGQRCAVPFSISNRCSGDSVAATKQNMTMQNLPCSTSAINSNSVGDKQGDDRNSVTDGEQSKGKPQNDINSRSRKDSACFPADAGVQLVDGRSMRMDELSIGDQVLCDDKEEYAQVIGFSHAKQSAVSFFRRVTLDSGHALDASHGHYVYVRGEGEKRRLVRMQEVGVGDRMILGIGTENTVVGVEDVWGYGLYNPQTSCGNIVVNGIVVSAYTSTINPATAHALLSVARFGRIVKCGSAFAGALIDRGSNFGWWVIDKTQ